MFQIIYTPFFISFLETFQKFFGKISQPLQICGPSAGPSILCCPNTALNRAPLPQISLFVVSCTLRINP